VKKQEHFTHQTLKMTMANVVGMVVSIQKTRETTGSVLGKLFYQFPEAKDREACFETRMLMLDGYSNEILHDNAC
jgi:hypothetical protein